MTTRVFVSPVIIRRNKETGKNNSTIIVVDESNTTYCHSATIDGPSKVVYDPDGKEKYGASVFVETEAKVICHE